MQAAVPRVSADAAPAVTTAPWQRSRLARYYPALSCSSRRRTGYLAALATAADRTPLPPPPYPLLDFLEFGRPVSDGAALRAFSAADMTKIVGKMI